MNPLPLSSDGWETPPTILGTDSTFQARISKQWSHNPRDFFYSVASLGMQAAEALEHAHQVGIIHRDIKPGNLLVDMAGKLWVTDFGLACFEQGEPLTRTGDVVGTAAFMSPEQSAGSRLVDGRSDIYSLGATLYEFLLLRPPHLVTSKKSQFADTARHDVTSLRRFDARIPRDLETIVIKSLSKYPADRYQTARAMADDLRLFLWGKPIKARRLSLIERCGRRLQQHRRLAAVLSIPAALLLSVSIAAMAFHFRQVVKHTQQLEAVLAVKDDALKAATIARGRAEQEQLLAEQHLQRATASERRVRRLNYLSDVQRAFEYMQQDKLSEAAKLVARQVPAVSQQDLRGMEWHVLDRELQTIELLGTHEGPVTESVGLGRSRVATAGEDGLVKIWALDSQSLDKRFDPKIGPIHAMAISPNGKTLAVGGKPSVKTGSLKRVYLLNVETGECMGALRRHDATIESISFSPDGTLLAAGSRYEKIEVSKLDGTRLHSLATTERSESVAFSPDGHYLSFTIDKEEYEQVRVVNVATGKIVDIPHFRAKLVKWSPKGSLMASFQGHLFHVGVFTMHWPDGPEWHLVTSEPRQRLDCLEFTSDGRWLVGGDVEGKVHWWPIPKEDLNASTHVIVPSRSLQTHSDRVTSLVLSGDGRVVSGCADGSVKLTSVRVGWTFARSTEFAIVSSQAVAGNVLYLGCSDGTVRRSDFGLHAPSLLFQAYDEPVSKLAVSGDGSRIVTVSAAGQIDVRDTSGRVLWTPCEEQLLHNEEKPTFHVAISDDGHVLASTGTDQVLRVWAVGIRSELFSHEMSSDGRSVALSADGTLVACGSDRVHVFETESGKSLYESTAENEAYAVEFNPTGHVVASGHLDRSVRLVDIRAPESLKILRGHGTTVGAIAFSPDGRSIASYDWQDSIHFWDVDTGEAYGKVALGLPRFDVPTTRQLMVTGSHLIAMLNSDSEVGGIYSWALGNSE